MNDLDRMALIIHAIEHNWHTYPLSDSLVEQLEIIKTWLAENCQGKFITINSRVYLKEDKDATLFVLKWM